MHIENIGQEIASRGLDLNRDGVTTQVLVRIGIPYLDADNLSYICPFEITGIGDRRLGYSVGVDAVQALQLVMLMIGANLQYLCESDDGNLSWNDGGACDLGFPS